MTILNRVLGRLFDLLLGVLHGLPPLASLAMISLLVAMAMLAVYRATSDQARIADAKRRMQAGLFEIRLFNDDLGAILRAQQDILRHNLRYLGLSLVPMLWMIVPMVLVIAQLQSFYGYRGVQPGEAFLLQLGLHPDGNAPAGPPATAARPDLQLRLPAGLRAETPAVWLPSRSEMAWRIRAERPGRYSIEVLRAGLSLAKRVDVTDGFARLSPVRQQPGLGAQILYPAEPPLPHAAGIQSITVNYATRDIAVLGWGLPWMLVFFVLVILFALFLKGRFRVVF